MKSLRRISAFVNKWKKDRRVRLGITLAAVILSALVQAYALEVFVRSAGIISGGFTGIAMLIERLGGLWGLTIPMQITMLLMNIPVAFMCCKGISVRFTVFSLAQVFLSSVFLQIFSFTPIFTDEVLNVIFGGVIFGSAIVIALILSPFLFPTAPDSLSGAMCFSAMPSCTVFTAPYSDGSMPATPLSSSSFPQG